MDQLIRQVLFTGVAESKLAGVFPGDFHAQLRGLLCKVIAAHLADWKETALSSMVSPPKLVDFGACDLFLWPWQLPLCHVVPLFPVAVLWQLCLNVCAGWLVSCRLASRHEDVVESLVKNVCADRAG